MRGHYLSSPTRGDTAAICSRVLVPLELEPLGRWLAGGPPPHDPTLPTMTIHTFLEARNSMPLATW